MSNDLKALLLTASRQHEAQVELAVGTVTVRGLSRAEVHGLSGKFDSPRDFEVEFISLGLVEPAMTPDEVRTWQSIPGAGAELQAVSDKIEELSGLKAGADKS